MIRFAALALTVTLACPALGLAQPEPPGQPGQSSGSSLPAPSAAMSASFTSFFTQVLGGHVPRGNVSQQVKTGLTPSLIAQIDSAFTSLGKFRQLQFVSADEMSGYKRYHYMAVFENGSQGIMFVVDSTGAIAGFFQDQPRGATQQPPQY